MHKQTFIFAGLVVGLLYLVFLPAATQLVISIPSGIMVIIPPYLALAGKIGMLGGLVVIGAEIVPQIQRDIQDWLDSLDD